MAGTVIKNRILTLFSSSGSQKTVGDVNKVTAATNNAAVASENLTRNSTRLGQASASAGRTFSAQSKGMGGLVGTYAAAAATVFTLQQAFSALSAAARAETVVAGTNTLAQELSASGPIIIKNLQAITQGQLTVAEAATAANIALSAGFDTTQLNQMAEVAQKASRALGRDFSDALTRVTRGISKLEPELLDELGIFVRIDPAVNAYARSIGKTAAELSEYERRQAFATAALAEGERKFEEIDVTAASAQKSLERLRVNVIDLATAFGQYLLPIMTSLADFFTGKLGNSILLFTGLLTLVASKGISTVAHSIKGMGDTFNTWATNLATTAARAKGSFAEITTAAEAMNKSITARGGVMGDKSLSRDMSGLFNVKGVERDLATAAAGIREQFRKAVEISPEVMRNNIKVLQDVQKQVKTGSLAYTDAAFMIKSYESALQSAGVKAKAYTIASRAMAGAVNVVTAAFSKLQTAIIGIGLITAGLSIFGWLTDTDPVGEIGRWIKGINDLSVALEKGLVGAVYASAGGVDILSESFKALGATDAELEALPQRIASIYEGIQEATKSNISDANDPFKLQTTIDLFSEYEDRLASATQQQMITFELLGQMGPITPSGDMLAAAEGIELYTAKLQELRITASQSFTENIIDTLESNIQDVVAIITDANASFSEIAEATKEFYILNELLKTTKSLGIDTRVVFSDLANSTGLAAQQIADVFLNDILSGIDKTENALTIFGISVEKIGDNFSLVRMEEENRAVIDSFITVSNTIQSMNEDMMSGNINVTAFSTNLGGLEDRLAQLVEERKNQVDVEATLVASQDRQIAKIEEEISKYQELVRELESTERAYKNIQSVFSSEIKLFDTADAEGLVSLTGQIALNQEDIEQNQLEFLATTAALTSHTADIAGNAEAAEKFFRSQGQSGALLERSMAAVNAKAELFSASMQAISGIIFQLIVDAGKLEQEFKSASEVLILELEKLDREGLALEIELQINEAESKANLEQTLAGLKIQALETQIELVQARENAGEITEVEAIQQSSALRQEIITAEIALEEQRYKNAIDSLVLEASLIKQKLDNDIATLQAERDLSIADNAAKMSFLQTQAAQIRGLGSVFTSAGKGINTSLAATLSSGASALNKAILSALNNAAYSASVTPGVMAPINVPELDTAMNSMVDSFIDVNTLIDEVTNTQVEQLRSRADTEQQLLQDRFAAEQAIHDEAIARLGTERDIETLNTTGALADAGDSGGGGDEIDVEEQTQKIIDQYRELQDQYNSAFEDMKSAVMDVISSITQLVSAAILAQGKARAEYLKVVEEFSSFTLDSVTENLESVQDSLNESLESEISLREELRDITDELNIAQESYMESLSAQGVVIADSVENYVDTLMKQKKAVIDLNKASSKSQALGKQEATLVELQITAQENLEAVTSSRVEAESKLESMEKVLTFTSDVLTDKFAELSSTFTDLINKIQAFLGIAGAAGEAGISGIVGEIVGPVDSALRDFNDGLAELSKLQGESAEAAQAAADKLGVVATTSSSAEDVAWYNNSTTLTTIGQGLAGAMTGFGVGSSVSALVGDTGWATTVGGTIGGAIAGVFLPTISTAISSVIGTALGGVLNFAIPIVGSLIGSLIGSMFKKTPSAGASGTFGPDGYQTNDLSYRGGASRDTAEGLDSIANQTLTGIVAGLESAGIQFVDTISTSIKMSGEKISKATLQFADSAVTFSEESLGKGQAGAEAAAAFYAESFFAGLRVERDEEGLVTFRSLVVDAMTPNADDLQAAIDYFAELEDVAAKTAVAFNEAVAFAQSFNDTLLSLVSTGATTEQVFESISTAAAANAANLANYYSTFLEDTENTFGAASEQFADAQEAVRTNALAQIGLVEQVVDGTTKLLAITDASEDLNAGAILMNDIVTSIAAMGPALEAAGITDIDTTIATGINTSLEAVLTDIGEGLEDSIALLTNPANSAVFAFESLLENNATRISETEGALSELEAQLSSGMAISDANLTQAETNVELAKTLNGLEIESYLAGLTEAELMAIDSTMELDAATQDLVDAQLEALRVISETKGLEILIDSANDLYDSIGELTDSFIGLGYAGQQLVGTTSSDFYEILGGSVDTMETSVESLSLSLSQYTMNIASGTNIASNYNKALKDLNNAYAAGNINAEEYASGMAEVNDVTIEYIDILNDVYDQYIDTLEGISAMLEEARADVKNNIENLGEVIVEGVENYISATQKILGIFDETLAGVAKSGNSLFDLKDSATASLQESSKALQEFEKENMLSGRTSSEVTSELALVQDQLANMLANPIDLSGFMKISSLTAQQTRLQNEINTLSEVEAEYQKLLEDKTTSINDLAFVESTIIGMGDQLVDTRRQESDIIKEAMAAAEDFIKGQETLLTITNKLATANFNLNQYRVDETDAVYRMTAALDEFSTASESLNSNISDILGSDGGIAFIDAIVSTATTNTRQYYEQLGSSMSEVDAAVAQAAADATAYAISLIEVSNSLNAMLNPDLSSLDAVAEELTYDNLIGTALTDSFAEFNQDLIKYLDTEGMSLFYGAGGVFESFSNSLKTTLITDGFDVLTASGGPLENFNTYLMLTSQVITDLADDNAVFEISLEAVTTSVGILVTALGTAEGGFTKGAAALTVNTDAAIEGIDSYTTAIGTFNIAVTGSGTDASIDILANTIPAAIDSFASTINLFNQTMESLSISTVPTDISTDIVTEINAFDTDLASIEISGPNTLAANFSSFVNIFNSDVGAIQIEGTQTLTGNFTTAVNSFNSNVGNIVVTGSETLTGNFDTAIKLFNSTVGNMSITGPTALYGTMSTSIESFNSNLGSIEIVGPDTLSDSMITKIGLFNSTVGSIDITAIPLLTSRITETIEAIDFSEAAANFEQKVRDSISNPKTADSIVNTIDSIDFSTSTQAFSIEFDSVLQTIKDAFDGLLEVFSPEATSGVVALTAALDKLNETADIINNTSGLNSDLGELNRKLNNTEENVTAATTDFTELNKILANMTGSDGSLDDIEAAMNGIVADIEKSWDKAVAGGITVPVTAKPVTITPALSNGDSKSLDEISRNTNKYPVISGATYGTPKSFFAEGGYVSGPGTSTSDSIDARLSNGEFVVKASSVKAIGADVLNTINQTGSVGEAIRRSGRNGDNVVAHLNVKEVLALTKASSSKNPSINPKTGLLEFFNADAGAIGKLFREKEAKLLYDKYKTMFPTTPVTGDYQRYGGNEETWAYQELTASKSSPLSWTNSGAEYGYTSTYFDSPGFSRMFEGLKGAGSLVNTAADARNVDILNRLQSGYATKIDSNNGEAYRRDNNYLKINSSLTKGWGDVGWGPGNVYGGSRSDTVDWEDAILGGYIARPTQAISAYLEHMNANPLSANLSSPPALGSVQQFVDRMNDINGNFTNFYMLKNGGLVGDDFTVGNNRDRTQALLEPGEFVLRKQAVDAMGLDSAIRLNSTGDASGDIDVEVNIINNGNPIEAVSETRTRRENNKIIVDVVLDDIRTNGPITRQLRSIRK